MRIEKLVWDYTNATHIGEHQVTPDEIEELIFDDLPHFRRGPGENLYHVYGQTGVGRYLFGVLIGLSHGRGRVITARDMDNKERRLYRQQIKHR